MRPGAGAAVDDADLDVALPDRVPDAQVAGGQRPGVAHGVGDELGGAHEQVVAGFVGQVGEGFAEPSAYEVGGVGLVRDANSLRRRCRRWHRDPLPPWSAPFKAIQQPTRCRKITPALRTDPECVFLPTRLALRASRRGGR
ncbi:hypothetical protein GCM10028833_37350 [Glycomyces tarimensis]